MMMMSDEKALSSSGLFGDVVDNVTKILSVAPPAILVSTEQLADLNTVTTVQESGAARAERLIHQPTTYNTALSKAEFYDKLITSVDEGADEASAITKAGKTTFIPTVTVDLQGHALDSSGRGSLSRRRSSVSPLKFQTTVQHLGIHMVQSDFKRMQKQRGEIGASDYSLNMSRSGSSIDVAPERPVSPQLFSAEIAKAHATQIVKSGTAAEATLGKLKTVISRLNKLSSTARNQGGLVGINNEENEFSEEPIEVRRLKQKHAKLMILVNDYDIICDGAEWAREKVLRETYQKVLEAALEKNEKDLRAEYETQISHGPCEVKIGRLSQEASLVKEENTNLSKANAALLNELHELRLYKLSTSGEQELILEELAKRRMKYVKLKNKLKKANLKIDALEDELEPFKIDNEVNEGQKIRIGSAGSKSSKTKSTDSKSARPTSGSTTTRTKSDRPTSGSTTRSKSERPTSASKSDHSHPIEVEESEDDWASEFRSKPQTESHANGNESDSELDDDENDDLVSEATSRPKWNKSTTSNLLNQKKPASVIYVPQEIVEEETVVPLKDPIQVRDKKWREERQQLQEALVFERQKRKKLYLASAKKSNTARKLSSILLETLQYLSPAFDHEPNETRGGRFAAEISDSIVLKRDIIQDILKGLDSTVQPCNASDAEYLSQVEGDTDVEGEAKPKKEKHHATFAETEIKPSQLMIRPTVHDTLESSEVDTSLEDLSKKAPTPFGFQNVDSWIKKIKSKRYEPSVSSIKSAQRHEEMEKESVSTHTTGSLLQRPLSPARSRSRPASGKSQISAPIGNTLPKIKSGRDSRPTSAPIAGGFGRLQAMKTRHAIPPKRHDSQFQLHGIQVQPSFS